MDNLKQIFDDNCAEMYDILVDEIRRIMRDSTWLEDDTTDEAKAAVEMICDIINEYMLGDGVPYCRYNVKIIHPRLNTHCLEYAVKNTIERMKK